MSEEMIERVARAMAADQSLRFYELDSGSWESQTDYGREQWLHAARAAIAAYNPNERLSRAESLLKQALEAIESARSEPLFIMRDAIRNYLEDLSALSPLPQGEDT